MTMTNDELLAWLDSAASEMDALGEAAAAIRALEAKVLWMEGDMRVLRRRDDKLVAEIYELRADRDRLAGEVERLQQAIKRQASSARMGMDAATRIGANNVREAARLFAESQPAVIESERAANELLTDEVARLTSELAAARENEARWQRDVADAYGWMWCVNEEPGTPNRFPAERAAYNARKMLRDLLTHEQRGIGINRAVIQRDSARSAGEGEK